MPIVSCTNDLFAHLAGLGVASDHTVTAGIRNALGVWPGDEPTDDAYPVLGYNVTLAVTPPSCVCYLVTSGKFVRYEYSVEATMTFVCGIERVASVTETTRGPVLSVVIELDAQGTVTEGESLSGPSPIEGQGGAVRTNAVARTKRTTYELTASTDIERFQLAAFSLGLRTAMGV